MNKEKVICDDILSIALIVMFLILAFYFKLIAIMSLAVYPLSGLIIYGISKVYHSIIDNELETSNKIVTYILGCFYVAFSIFILILLFSEPHIPLYYIIYFLSILLVLIGLGGFLKGIIVTTYSSLYRRLNIFIGIVTLIFSFLGFFYAEGAFLFYLLVLISLLILNGLLRSALYLSEYGLTLKKFSNIRYVFYIMNTYQMRMPDKEEPDVQFST